MRYETKALALIVILSCVFTVFLYRPLFIERQAQRENARACQEAFDRADETPSVDPGTGLTMYPIPNCEPGPTPGLLPMLEYINPGYLMLSAVFFFLAGIAIGFSSYLQKRNASRGSCFLHLSSALFGISTQQQIVFAYPEFGMGSYMFIGAIIITLLAAWIFSLGSKSIPIRVMNYISFIYMILFLVFGFCLLWEAYCMLYFLVCIGGCITVLWRKRNPDARFA